MDVATLLVNVGNSYFELGKLSKALKAFKEALGIHKKILAPSHPHTAGPILGIGRVHSKQGNFTETLEAFEEALPLFKRLGSEHPHVATTLNCIAQLHERRASACRSGPRLHSTGARTARGALVGAGGLQGGAS